MSCHADFMEAIFDKVSLGDAKPYLKDANPQCEYSVNTTDDSVIVKVGAIRIFTLYGRASSQYYIELLTKVELRDTDASLMM